MSFSKLLVPVLACGVVACGRTPDELRALSRAKAMDAVIADCKARGGVLSGEFNTAEFKDGRSYGAITTGACNITKSRNVSPPTR